MGRPSFPYIPQDNAVGPHGFCPVCHSFTPSNPPIYPNSLRVTRTDVILASRYQRSAFTRPREKTGAWALRRSPARLVRRLPPPASPTRERSSSGLQLVAMGCAASTSAVDVAGGVQAPRKAPAPPPAVLLASPPSRPEVENPPRRRRRSLSSFEGEDAPFWKVKLRAPASSLPALDAIKDKYGDQAVEHLWLEVGEYKGVPREERGDEDMDEEHFFPEGHVAARWRNLQGLVEQVEEAPPSFGAALEAALAMRAELARYNKEPRLLLQLAHSGYFIDLSERFEAMLDALFATYGLPQSDFWTQWPRALRTERLARVQFFRELLEDEQTLTEEMGDDRQQLEILSLIKYDVTKHAAKLTKGELKLLADVYQHVASESGIILMALPHWFTPPCEILVHQQQQQQQQPEEEAASADQLTESYETWGGRRVATIVVPREWSEEFFIWQASRWAEMRHAHVLSMLGACHVGPDMFYIHEEVMGVDKLFLEGAPKWRILYQVALGLQYLHERGLVHAGVLSMDSIIISSGDNKGLLTGVGWVPRSGSGNDRNAAAREYARQSVFGGDHYLNGESAALNTLPPSVLNDLVGFGRCIVGVLRGEAWRQSGYPSEFPTELNVEGLADSLVKSFIGLRDFVGKDDDMPVTLSLIVQVLEELSVQEHKLALGTSSNHSNDSGDAPLPQLLLDINTYAIGTVGAPLVTVMENVRALTERVTVDFSDVTKLNQQVYERFADLYAHVSSQANGVVDAIFLRSFGPLLECFCGILERLEERKSIYTTVLWGLATRKATEDYLALHHRMDRLLTLLELEKPSDVHNWRAQWDKSYSHLHEGAMKVLMDSKAIVASVASDFDESSARFVLASLLFELSKHRSSYPDDAADAMIVASIELSQIIIGNEEKSGKRVKKNGKHAIRTYDEFLPGWFVPAYEVLYSSLYEKIPNQVYLGDWFDTPAIVYKTVGKRSPQSSAAFGSMVEKFVRIDHPNVIRTYGACHVGNEQVLLCEMTRTSSLKDLVANGATHPAYIWSYIRDAAMGLEYLHQHGIVHGNLQSSVIMMGTDDKIKLTEFGTKAALGDSETEKAPTNQKRAMARWVAPEILDGEEHTEESDVYALGMCLVQALTSEEPWGPDVSEVAVISAVKKGHLPPRPTTISPENWALVRRMCRPEPHERAGLAAVIAWATNAARSAAFPVSN